MTGPVLSAIIERLREGPLSPRDAREVCTDRFALKVHIRKLRLAGFDIVSEPDEERRAANRQSQKAIRYVLKSEPKGLSR